MERGAQGVVGTRLPGAVHLPDLGLHQVSINKAIEGKIEWDGWSPPK